MKKTGKRITDRMRLNFLEAMKASAAPMDWVGVFDDGTIILSEPSELDSKYELVSNARPKIRQAIDAAIRAEKRKTK